MRSSFIIMAAAVAACLPVNSRADVVDGVRAVVDNKAITYAEVMDYAHDALAALRAQYSAQPDIFQAKFNQLLSDATEQLVERQLILHSFDTDGYRLPDGVVDQLVQDRIHNQYGDRVTLIKTLQARGMTFEQFRQQVRDQYIAAALRNQNVQREVVISPAKMEAYYKSHQDDFKVGDQVKLRMIVLNKTGADDTNTLKLADEIEAQLKGGAKFTQLAGIYSQGSQQHQGGDWGWVEKSVLRTELADAAFALPTGKVSQPIELADSVYIMLVEDRRSAHVKALADVRNEIEKTLRLQQQARLEAQWIDGLKKKTFIRYFD